MPENENEQRPSALLGDWFVSTPESEAMLAEEVEALRQNEKDQKPCPSCDRDLSYPGAPGHVCYTYAEQGGVR